MAETVILEFRQSYPPYQAGEVAGFPPKVAQRILGATRQRTRDEPPSPVARKLSDKEIRSARAARPPVVPKPPEELVAVLFTAGCGRYRPGEIAGFPPKVAKVLCEGGRWEGVMRPPVAEPYEAKDEAKPPKPARKKAAKPPDRSKTPTPDKTGQAEPPDKAG